MTTTPTTAPITSGDVIESIERQAFERAVLPAPTPEDINALIEMSKSASIETLRKGMQLAIETLAEFAAAPSAAEQVQVPSGEVENLLEQYWNIAHEEGRSGLSSGSAAQTVLNKIRAALAQRAVAADKPVGYVPSGIIEKLHAGSDAEVAMIEREPGGTFVVPLYAAPVAASADAAPVGAVAVKVERNHVWIVKGVQSFMLAYEGETDEELNWYADKLRSIFTPCVKSGIAAATEAPPAPIPKASSVPDERAEKKGGA